MLHSFSARRAHSGSEEPLSRRGLPGTTDYYRKCTFCYQAQQPDRLDTGASMQDMSYVGGLDEAECPGRGDPYRATAEMTSIARLISQDGTLAGQVREIQLGTHRFTGLGTGRRPGQRSMMCVCNRFGVTFVYRLQNPSGTLQFCRRRLLLVGTPVVDRSSLGPQKLKLAGRI